jgi:hypothetical protein
MGFGTVEEPVMRNAEEFSGRRSGLARMLPAYRRSGSRAGRAGSGRIRYAHGGAFPRVEPYCTVFQGSQGLAVHRGDPGPGEAGGGATDTGLWLAEPPVGGRQGDVWVLVCGGIAAAAAFAAAFVASGGVASHPAAPAARMPAVVSQACPSPTP